MDLIEYPIRSSTGSVDESVGILKRFRSPVLSNIVEAVWECEVPDRDIAKTLTIKCAPGTPLLLIGQYRIPAEIRQGDRLLPEKCATQILSHAVTLRPTGAFGVVIVSLRPEAARRVVESPISDFANASVHLGGLFGTREVAMCDDMLVGARTSEERIAGIYSFLVRHLRPRADNIASRAALCIRRDPTIRMHSLAATLGISARHLSREFSATFGTSPKRFARLVRFQRVLAERQTCRSWAQVAHACGLRDQAHLIKEFQDIVGESPTQFFTRELRLGADGSDEANLIIQYAPPMTRL
jgi:AraC-like DNA-binding protein